MLILQWYVVVLNTRTPVGPLVLGGGAVLVLGCTVPASRSCRTLLHSAIVQGELTALCQEVYMFCIYN